MTEHKASQGALKSVIGRLPGNIIAGVVTAAVIYLLLQVGELTSGGVIVEMFGGATQEEVTSMRDELATKEELQILSNRLEEQVERLDRDDVKMYEVLRLLVGQSSSTGDAPTAEEFFSSP